MLTVFFSSLIYVLTIKIQNLYTQKIPALFSGANDFFFKYLIYK